MEYNVRNAKPEDSEAIVDINLKMWRWTYSHLLSEEVLQKREEDRDSRISSQKESVLKDNSLCFVAEKDNKVVGFAFGAYQNMIFDDKKEIPQLFAMYILPEAQNTVLSIQMAKAFVKQLKSKGFSQMYTGCLVGNKFNLSHVALGGKFICKHYNKNLNLDENIYFYENIDDILSLNLKKAMQNIKNFKKLENNL